ncbi:MAG TPA: enoyl-CoA hydratase [Burkholderiales bacterium]|nr:enoyl-CoA hydratase [Burkholderiales bacterium]
MTPGSPSSTSALGALASGGSPLLRRDAGGIATLTLNRPAQYNALDSALLACLEKALEAIAQDAAVRVVVIAGAGRAFCAGHDLKELRAHPDPGFARAVFERCARLMIALTRLPQPVIARVHGPAFAAGCQLVAQCDLAVASTEASFATSGVKFGLFCSTPGVALARSLPRKQALEMLLTGEPIGAQAALAGGLVNRVVAPEELDAEVARLASSILAKSAAAVALGKKAFYAQAEAGLEEAYRLAVEAMACNMAAEDAAEGIEAFIEKRPPRWKNK